MNTETRSWGARAAQAAGTMTGRRPLTYWQGHGGAVTLTTPTDGPLLIRARIRSLGSMSIALVQRVLEAALPGPSHKLVLLAFANHADEQSECWPSRKLIADRTHLSERQVRRIMTDLKRLGLLEVIKRETHHSTPTYRVRGDKLSPLMTTREDIHGLRGGTSATDRGDTHVPLGGTPTSPKPSVEPSKEPSVKSPGRFAPTQDDPDWFEKRYKLGKAANSED